MTEWQLGQMLYGVTSKGKIKTWRCDVNHMDEGQAQLSIITQTKIDGKPIVRRELITKGKNIGKSNETTPYEQAIKEAEARYRKQIKKGYRTEIPTDLTQMGCNALGLPHPMLALALKVVKSVLFAPLAYVQFKYDGHRCIATKQNGVVMLYSRGGEQITTMGHIATFLHDRLEEGEFLDGELYIHGELLQNIGSYIRKYHPGISEKIVYYVYDTIMDVPYTQRLDTLRKRLVNASGPVFLARTEIVRSIEEALEFRDYAITQGYEGAMLRCPDKGYQAGKKSRTLIKLKLRDDAEFKIIDVVEGKDRIVNGMHLKVACFICEVEPDKTFDVTAYGDQYDKDRAWHERESFMNQMLTVEFSGFTKDGIPWHPVALRLREDI
jgi:DNA ligase-1